LLYVLAEFGCCLVCWLQRLEELVNELEPELYPPEYIAEEVRAHLGLQSCAELHDWMDHSGIVEKVSGLAHVMFNSRIATSSNPVSSSTTN
jgi:hypothetical protein